MLIIIISPYYCLEDTGFMEKYWLKLKIRLYKDTKYYIYWRIMLVWMYIVEYSIILPHIFWHCLTKYISCSWWICRRGRKITTNISNITTTIIKNVAALIKIASIIVTILWEKFYTTSRIFEIKCQIWA